MSPASLITAALFALAMGCSSKEPAPAVTGLRVFDNHTSDVSGTFHQGEASIDFTFVTGGDTHVATIRCANGKALVESRIVDGNETTTYLGRFTIDASGRAIGDATALEDLAAMPEAKLLRPMRTALDRFGVADAVAASVARYGWWARIASDQVALSFD
jgi:hypothetical protein